MDWEWEPVHMYVGVLLSSVWLHCCWLYRVISLQTVSSWLIYYSFFFLCKWINPLFFCCTNRASIITQLAPSLACHGNSTLKHSSCCAAHGALSRSHPRPHINRQAASAEKVIVMQPMLFILLLCLYLTRAFSSRVSSPALFFSCRSRSSLCVHVLLLFVVLFCWTKHFNICGY